MSKLTIAANIHANTDDPAHSVSYENSESRELWQTHMSAPHLAAYMKATDGAVAEFRLHEMTPISEPTPKPRRLYDFFKPGHSESRSRRGRGL